MKKYDMHICRCGKLHMVPLSAISIALEHEKILLVICADCGEATIIGADKMISNNDNKTSYILYKNDFSPYESVSITKNDFSGETHAKAISEIYYSYGIKVPMMNGYYATEYRCGVFRDGKTWTNLYEIDRANVSAEDVQEFIKKERENSRTVNMQRLIKENTDEIIKEISSYFIKGFNWKGTKYENKYNA